MSNGVCGCNHHKIVPLAIILIGLDIVLQTLGIIGGMWPMLVIGILLIVIGTVRLGSRKCKCCVKS